MNYNKIHPNNKKVKRLSLRNAFPFLYPKIVLISAIGASQIRIINQNAFSDKNEKTKMILKTAMNTSFAVMQALDEPRLQKLQKTGWYGLKKGELKKRKEAQEAYRMSDEYLEGMMFSGSR